MSLIKRFRYKFKIQRNIAGKAERMV